VRGALELHGRDEAVSREGRNQGLMLVNKCKYLTTEITEVTERTPIEIGAGVGWHSALLCRRGQRLALRQKLWVEKR
jgi:hypothetical protein